MVVGLINDTFNSKIQIIFSRNIYLSGKKKKQLGRNILKNYRAGSHVGDKYFLCLLTSSFVKSILVLKIFFKDK